MHGDQQLFTYHDSVEHLLAFAGYGAGNSARQDARRAAVEGLRELRNLHEWSAYYKTGRITTVASYATGTITYDDTGGSNEREVTLVTGTWPSWAARGILVIDNITYRVGTRISDTVITLDANSNPGADVASGTSYNLYRDTYELPLDFGKFKTELIDIANKSYVTFTHPKNWLATARTFINPSRPYSFTVVGSDDFYGAMAVKFAPAPEIVRNYDFIYQKNARRLIHDSVKAGTVSVTASTITGVGTAFTSDMVGAVVRVSSSSSAPTNQFGDNPFDQERVITSFASATSVTVDQAWDTTRSTVKYVISDPLDIDINVMLNAYLRTCEKRFSHLRHSEDIKSVTQDWSLEIKTAMAADNRMRGTRRMGGKERMSFGKYLVSVSSLGADID